MLTISRHLPHDTRLEFVGRAHAALRRHGTPEQRLQQLRRKVLTTEDTREAERILAKHGVRLCPAGAS